MKIHFIGAKKDRTSVVEMEDFSPFEGGVRRSELMNKVRGNF